MKEIYITGLLMVLCTVFGYTALCPQDNAIMKAHVKYVGAKQIGKTLQMYHDWRHYRFLAVIKADSLGITPEEALAQFDDKVASDNECEFYSSLFNR